ncbi:unnamed protein product [Arabidopsis halleri]
MLRMCENVGRLIRPMSRFLSQMPYFQRSGGRVHIFVFPSGAGAHLFRSWSTFINHSIILTPEGWLRVTKWSMCLFMESLS